MGLFNRIKRNLTSDDVFLRIITTYICFLLVFFPVTIVSYYLLPQGLMLNKNPLKNWDTSPNLIISSLQILAFNLLSVVVILFGNTFLVRRNKSQYFVPLGYLAFFAGIIINAVVLGTWSFSAVTDAIPLISRLIGTFDIFKRAGLWEMSGQIFILCSTVNISLIITDGKETSTKNWKTIKLTKKEIIVFSVGLILMLLGALIESYAIININ